MQSYECVSHEQYYTLTTGYMNTVSTASGHLQYYSIQPVLKQALAVLNRCYATGSNRESKAVIPIR